MITSLMMVTFNRLELTKRTIASLFEKTDLPFRLIIIDNNSIDDTKFFLNDKDGWLAEQVWKNKYCVGLDTHLNPENKGIAVGRNQCLKIANKYNDPYLCTLDNDIEFIPNWLSKCLDFLSVNPRFCVGLNMEGVKYPIRTINGKTIQGKIKGNLGTANMVFSRELHNKIGYFPTEFGLYGEEDAQFGMRARIAGWDMGYLVENGIHLGEGEFDQGEYREFKTESHKRNLAPFQKSCRDFFSGKRSIYIDFE